MEQSEDLLILDTRDIMDISVGKAIRKVEALGEGHYQNFVNEILLKCEKSITYIIIKINWQYLIIHQLNLLQNIKCNLQLKNDCNLFSHLYISCLTRSGDLDVFLLMKTRRPHHPYH